MITGNEFTYSGISSATYNLRILNINTEENKKIGGDMEYTTFRNRLSPKLKIIKTSYKDEAMSIPVEFVSETEITEENFLSMCTWLKGNSGYRKLTFNNNTTYSGYCFNCYFDDLEKIQFTKYYGIKATMYLDSNFMWAENNEIVTSTTFPFVINNLSAVQIATHPISVIIKVGATGGTVSLHNVTTSELTTITNTIPHEIITITTYPKAIVGSGHDSIWEYFNKNWLYLISGNNSIGKVGDIVEVTIQYEKARFII